MLRRTLYLPTSEVYVGKASLAHDYSWYDILDSLHSRSQRLPTLREISTLFQHLSKNTLHDSNKNPLNDERSDRVKGQVLQPLGNEYDRLVLWIDARFLNQGEMWELHQMHKPRMPLSAEETFSLDALLLDVGTVDLKKIASSSLPFHPIRAEGKGETYAHYVPPGTNTVASLVFHPRGITLDCSNNPYVEKENILVLPISSSLDVLETKV